MKWILAVLVLAMVLIAGCVGCTPSWSCDEWSTCRGGSQTRSCVDANVCNITEDKPVEIQDCVCEEDWTCTDWNSCPRVGMQDRLCTDQNVCGTINNKLAESQSCTPPKTSEYVIQLQDFPSSQNYTLKERAERVKSDIDKEAVEWGWKEGYYISYIKFGESQLLWSRIDQLISVYPVENVSKTLDLTKITIKNHIASYDLLDNPNLGNESIAYRFTETDSVGTKTYYYIIEFVKFDIYERTMIYGTMTDYEILKDLAKKAEGKIL